MQPVDMHPVGDTEILMTWDDGHRSLFAYDYLRLNCPCATCCDEWSGKRLITHDQIARHIKPLETVMVGRYAIRFRWNDGHQTGIYGFDFLRKLCRCEVCKSSQGQGCGNKECNP